ncbi:methyltransferase family protein [Luteibacter rhizovicinus]|uniref:methyltransferase family protein n=1 Tax=Luteibacter rhizovicinus TaxID=242606 RepID=UPI001052BBD7|nr:isoprenylcysteine carboxylmethyltransferase family protein [Luteibacter rhizovicinus]
MGFQGNGCHRSGRQSFALCHSRRHLTQALDRIWSVAAQLKQEYELIQSGPYRFVRHPIYSGLLLAFLGATVVWVGFV